MTVQQQHLPHPLSSGTDYQALAERFRPIFARIAAGALEREQTRSLPFEQVKWLKEAGFGAVRVPVQYGGAGASLPQLFELLIELAEADSNLPQALRGHFAFVEDRLNAHADAPQDTWFKRFVDGDLVGNAWTEVGSIKIGQVGTRVSRLGEQWVVNGTKYYSTGSIFADWIDLYAQRDDNGADVIAAVRVQQPGIVQSDDWDGFGQRTTGSGTSVFENAVVEPENLLDFTTRFKYQTAFYQLVLLAVQTGAGRAAVRDITEEVRKRTRIFSTGNASHVSQDVQVQQVVGKASAQVYAAHATTLRAAAALQVAYESRFAHNDEAERDANIAAELESAQAQVVIADLVLRATSDLFNALSASATSTGKALDRHWRNARTAASHNPLIYKERIIGDWEINGTEPPYVWQIGGGSK
ncbi:alkylation response protein AidB-like acyl-CoA dehydrogenase [Pseudomonas sp. PvR086]|jgi:alkylation response protein AidB-like acyl-CoA dehydrogenase|uniref:acyl-CoA dehydrogenase family protein n=1 Tax=Pseudomonas TaxID=286 RepID=UPI000372E3C8|nr:MULTISPECIES: acyl-CoA dehydrogenase family protein [Pseudomonas]ANI60275.1 monooxygenase [Pseudomonas sp. GR 6-02]MBD9604174.1 acyl-CoA dehydrogenase family protein [Pseudomonas sp. PDM08]MDR7104534.1 alkylation response protein AidB-like acyl-CoA dehydrogenase [Pseudomonas frederiksbergensis]PZW64801.1 alkylation response protein AidB-like acyl-CoA dehydrogenase [Pseudomonas sp. URMO17WK12:I6]